ncbi:hypothetical protein HNQ63_001793 [Wenzhouxiangella marina]|uniref:Uncharacterized protein n=1 Tax=Wenzhouxiangella marina TaxID=1579979 RepID=A0A0K0XZE6_9GAMM|nr:hypothetical protein WM2015_2638 [Wenzhouxiangella marina]MBB6087321.1 hypothetical protein [Wenzhouxiangella marina]
MLIIENCDAVRLPDCARRLAPASPPLQAGASPASRRFKGFRPASLRAGFFWQTNQKKPKVLTPMKSPGFARSPAMLGPSGKFLNSLRCAAVRQRNFFVRSALRFSATPTANARSKAKAHRASRADGDAQGLLALRANCPFAFICTLLAPAVGPSGAMARPSLSLPSVAPSIAGRGGKSAAAMSERRERSDRSEFGGARHGREAQGTQRSFPRWAIPRATVLLVPFGTTAKRNPAPKGTERL